MNHCNVGNISLRIGQIALYESTFANSSSPNGLVALENYTNFIDQLRLVFDDLRDGGLNSAAEFVATTYNNIHKTPDFRCSVLNVEARHLREQITKAMSENSFLRVSSDRVEYLDKADLFGADVANAFGSAKDEIKAAGHCLATECSTAAVFHLMRVAEIGLRALAYDREVHIFKNAKTMFEIPLELATWEQLIRELEEAEKAIQGFPQTLVREKQFDFYHGALMQYRAFKNVFRNSIMHTRDSYDRDEAMSAYNKVKEFMKILASRIKEDVRTPTIWS
jgi:hypothetical protein